MKFRVEFNHRRHTDIQKMIGKLIKFEKARIFAQIKSNKNDFLTIFLMKIITQIHFYIIKNLEQQLIQQKITPQRTTLTRTT